MYYSYFKPTPEQIKAFVEKHFPEYKTRKNGLWLCFNSPFVEDTGKHFGVNVEQSFCNDWRGNEWAPEGKAGKKRNRTFTKFVQLYLNCNYPSAVRAITGARPGLLPAQRPSGSAREAPEPKEGPSLALPEGSFPILKSPESRMATIIQNWLLSRGITQKDIEKYDIRHCGDMVIWPYYEYESIVYWQGRSATSKRFEFPSEEECGVGKAHFIYNFDHIEPASHLILTEACIDCITLGDQVGATGGASLSLQQIKKIKLLGPKDGIILAPDNDDAGVKSVLANYTLLKGLGYDLYYSLPPKLKYGEYGETKIVKDWNDLLKMMSRSEVREQMEKVVCPIDKRALFRLTSMLQRKNNSY